MKICIMTLLVLAVTGIVWAADVQPSPGASAPAAEKPAEHGHDKAMDPERTHKEPQQGEVREGFAEKHEEYIKWLEKNYPADANELAKIKQEEPEHYLHSLNESFEKYGRLCAR